jgi:hypothetical protein
VCARARTHAHTEYILDTSLCSVVIYSCVSCLRNKMINHYCVFHLLAKWKWYLLIKFAHCQSYGIFNSIVPCGRVFIVLSKNSVIWVSRLWFDRFIIFPRLVKTTLTFSAPYKLSHDWAAVDISHVCFLIVLSLLQYQQVLHHYLSVVNCLDVVIQSGTLTSVVHSLMCFVTE